MNPHLQHRQRMKTKFLSGGAAYMAPHELLEMLLYFSKPQGDTNPCAHELIERFGGIRGVLNAAPDELMKVDGVGEHTATLIKLLPELLRVYEREMHAAPRYCNSLSKIVEFLHPNFVSATHERLYLLLLNNRMELIDSVLVAEGTVNKCDVLLRMISDRVHAKNASYVIMAHNHPDGIASPSREDLSVTNTVFHHLNAIDVTLLEHIVFTETHFYPILKNALGSIYYEYDVANQAKQRLAENFYDINEDTYEFRKFFDIDGKGK